MNELSTFNSLFNDLFGADYSPAVYRNGCYAPKVDIKEEKNAYTLEMELPGKCEKDVNIELDHDNLTISSVEEKETNEKKEKDKFILKERTCRAFSRRFILPSDVDSESITANFKNGVLTVNLQKKPVAAPKKIAISA
ncbi:MAG: Hsp20/alpha crystallin family protein [Treponema sp.]|nr:Hsp20/alpha crystallin family protein [Treponema sp.]